MLLERINYYFLLFTITVSLNPSNAFFIFRHLKKVQENTGVCVKFLGSNDDVAKILNTLNFNETNFTCFLKCVYENAKLVNRYGSVKLSQTIPIIEGLITTGGLQTVEDRRYIASNLILICESDEKLICSKVVQTMNCLELAIYLYNSGYIKNGISNEQPDNLKLKEIFREAVMKFQLFFNLEVTGIPDEEMRQLVSKPRCGVVDIEQEADRKKRYTIADDKKWQKKELSYKISKYPETLSKKEVDDRIAEAFYEWAKQTPLRIIRKVSGEVDIEIDFVKDNHGDEIPFDGPGGYLAHTFYPRTYADKSQKSFIHFDLTEKWTTADSKPGVRLFQVALHEIGHSLGLKHSKKKDAIMWPLHKNDRRNYTLAKDDIRGIQKLYNPKKKNGFFKNIKSRLSEFFKIKH